MIIPKDTAEHQLLGIPVRLILTRSIRRWKACAIVLPGVKGKAGLTIKREHPVNTRRHPMPGLFMDVGG